MSGAGQAEQATRQRWPPPGPAPKTIIALSSGRLAIRPRWIVHRCYSGPWRPAARPPPPRSRSPRELLVAARLLGLALRVQDTRPFAVLRRRHQEGPGRFVDHRHLPFANRFVAMLHASGAASTLQRRGIPHTRHSCGCASVPPDPTQLLIALRRKEVLPALRAAIQNV
jgi:hypothetical protein